MNRTYTGPHTDLLEVTRDSQDFPADPERAAKWGLARRRRDGWERRLGEADLKAYRAQAAESCAPLQEAAGTFALTFAGIAATDATLRP
ncbi:hypothetical protein AAFF_G00183170 [Aldrovandia affinis]|uniref:Uncharacterized protein n=1 Tax=Aldrovandia affinis TaxID=143900 RepID=A0AAD7RKS5_9TELE|nr:hypothetical protein AAFF_G00183170 [Aldrovandia affinis]